MRTPSWDSVWHKYWFWGVLLAFWVIGFQFSYSHGNKVFHRTDGMSEGLGIFAAEHYVDHGFWSTKLLPFVPPFGFDNEGNYRDKPFVYTHYFPGPSLVLGAVMKIFGKNAVWMTRLIPLALTIFALALLALEFIQYIQSSLAGCVLLSLLILPRSLHVFSIGWWGQSYSMAFYLLLMGFMLGMVNRPASSAWNSSKWAWIVGIATGFFQLEFEVDWLPLSFIAAASFAFLVPKNKDVPLSKQVKKILLGMVIGGGAALVLQVVLATLYYGSINFVFDDFMQFGKWRMGLYHFKHDMQDDHSLRRVLHEYNRQAYGATGFTGMNLAALCITFLILSGASKIKDRKEIVNGFVGLALAYLAAIFWNITMRQHSLAHTHFLPRHYYVLYFTFLIVAIPASVEMIRRGRAYVAIERSMMEQHKMESKL